MINIVGNSYGALALVVAVLVVTVPSFRHRRRRKRRACNCRCCQALASARQRDAINAVRHAERVAVLNALNDEMDAEYGPGYADRWLKDFHVGNEQTSRRPA